MFLLLASVLTPSLGLDNFGYVLLIVTVVAVVVVVAVVSDVAVVVAACKGFAMRVELSWVAFSFKVKAMFLLLASVPTPSLGLDTFG